MMNSAFASFTVYNDDNQKDIYTTGDLFYESDKYVLIPRDIGIELYIKIKNKKFKKQIIRVGQEVDNVSEHFSYIAGNGLVVECDTSNLEKLKKKIHDKKGIWIDKLYSLDNNFITEDEEIKC